MKVESLYQNERGAVALSVAISLIVLLGLAAFAVDLGYGLVTNHQLQNVADSAALVAARELGRIYEGMSLSEQQAYVLTGSDQSQIFTRANTAAQNNVAAGQFITINNADLTIGTWDSATNVFTVTTNQPTAVQIVTRRDATSNGPITTFFGRIFSVSHLNVTAVATAALLPINTVPPGGIGLPVGISKAWFEGGGSCGDSIKFQPTGTLDGCAGWHTFDNTASAANLRNVLNGLEAGTYQSPEIVAGDTQVNFTGGSVGSVFDDMVSLYDAMKDPLTGEWKTFIPVYDRNDCSNPSGPITIVGFATVTVTSVVSMPDKQIIARVECSGFESGRPGSGSGGGGGNFGTFGTIPLLVS